MRISVQTGPCEKEEKSPVRQPGAIRALVLCFLPAELKTKTSEYNCEMSFFFLCSTPPPPLQQIKPGDINRETERVRDGEINNLSSQMTDYQLLHNRFWAGDI